MLRKAFKALVLIVCTATSAAGFATAGNSKSDSKNVKNGETKKENLYIIDDKPFSPIEIVDGIGKTPIHHRRLTILRDPGFTAGPVLEPRKNSVLPGPKKPSKPQREIKVKHPKSIKFQKVMVKGYHTEPRVEFTDETLTLDRSDEPLPENFLQKTFDEESSL